MRIRLNIFERQLDAPILAQRHIQYALDVGHILVAKRCLQLQTPFARGFGPGHINHAANRISTKQRSLRSPQHLDRFHVEHVKNRAGVTGHEYAVYGDTYCGLERLLDIVETDSADAGAQ